jgi:RNA polymerase sigma-70 factor (ECF subfamily)
VAHGRTGRLPWPVVSGTGGIEPGTQRPGGDVPTWEEVARRHGRFLYTVAYRLTGNDDDAQDLVQEVLLRVRRGLASYQPGSMEGWLSRITTNAFLDETRRRRRRPVVALPDDVDRVAPPSEGADAAAIATSLSADVQLALGALPEEFRVAVVLCDVVGLPYAEIAETLDVPVGTVRSRIHRGRLMLREALQ